METLYAVAQKTIEDWTQDTLGVRAGVHPSQKAMLASSQFVREDAAAAARELNAHRMNCTLLGGFLIGSVRSENGWLLFDLDRAAFDAWACALPSDFPHGSAYVDRRMELLLRHGDCPLPDVPSILHAVLAASFASTRKKWTQADERTVLTMTHALSGMQRVQAEQRAARAAKIILYERRNLL